MTTYHTYGEIDQWLAENFYFEDGHILHIETDPLAITIGYNIKGNLTAYSERHIRSFKLRPSTILEWTYPKSLIPSEDHYIGSIEPLEVQIGVGIEFFDSPNFRLVADSFDIMEQIVIKTIFKPWLSDSEIFAEIILDAIPTPAFWKQRFSEFGYDILFRCYGGEGAQPEKVPYPGYSGYFIQLRERIKETKQGLFISSISQKNGIVSLLFQNHDSHLGELWTILIKILSDFPHIKIKSGNCEFTGNEWKNFLADGRH